MQPLSTYYWFDYVLVFYDSVYECISDFTCMFQESLRKIITTLALKNEEIQNFICCLKQNLENLEVITIVSLLFLLTFS